MKRTIAAACLAAVLLAMVSAIPASADTVTISNIANLQPNIDGASGPRTIEIVAGTYTLPANINVNKPDITIQGQGVLATIIQVSGTGYRFSVTGTGCTIRNLDLVKTDKPGLQDIIWINANNVTIQNNRIHGQFVIGDGDVSRAMVISGGLSNMLIDGNTIFALRQPGYFSGALTPSPAGTVSSNFVYGTKGWVIEGGNMVFTGNTWGTGANANVYDIAILAGVQAGFYPDIVAMSNANNAAVIEDQRPSPAILSIVAVDAAAAPGGAGSPLFPYQTIAPALARVAVGGTIHVAAGTYAGPGGINAAVSLLGPNAEICAHDASRVAEAVINTGSPAIRVGTTAPVFIKGFKFDGCGLAVDSYTSGSNLTMQNDIFVNTTAQTFFFSNPNLLTYDCNYVSAINAGDECLFIAGDWNGSTGSRATINNSVWENTPSSGMNLSSVNAAITGNRFTNVAYYAALLANNSGGTTVTGNTFDNIVNPNPPGSGSWGAGIRFYTPSITTPVSITANHFLNSYAGVAVRAGSDITGQPISVTGNDFVGNLFGIRNLGTGTLAATCNWYGSALGPNVVPTNPSPGDVVEGPVSYAPWLTGAIPGGLCNGYGLNRVEPLPPATCISVAHPCVTVPVDIARSIATGVRGYSVTFQLSANLALCNGLTSDVTQGAYLNSVGGTNFQVVDNTGGSYTVDCAILGATLGATAASGNLFNMSIKNVGGDGTGTVTVTSVALRDPNNVPVFSIPGPPASVTIDNTAPVAITALVATQLKVGNDTDGTTKIRLNFTAPGDAASIEAWRKGYGNYPEYNDAPGAGSVPSLPSSYANLAAEGWTKSTTVAASGQFDEPAARDFWYYVAYAKDACGNVSPVSAMTGGTLNYHLGDVSPVCGGDNTVGTADVSYLGANYGVTLANPDVRGCLDVGPTTDYSVNARPTTDSRIDFEDLIVFAMNYNVVSLMVSHGPSTQSTLASFNDLTVEAPQAVQAGEMVTASLRLEGAGDIQGLTAKLAWDHGVVEPVSVAAGEMIANLNGVVMSSVPGTVDAALLGVREQGLSGDGVLATVTFRALAAGNPGIGLARAEARDAANHAVKLGQRAVVDVPRVTALMAATPNPFRDASVLAFSLARRGPVQLVVYSVDGRKLRTLANDTREAGVYRFAWDGRDDRGNSAKPGVFFARLTTVDGHFSRTVLKIQ